MQQNFVLKNARTGTVTCEVSINNKSFFLHSSYDPVKEAHRFIQNHISQLKSKKRIIIYGIGCGYHIAALLQINDTVQEIEVWDFNVDLFEFVRTEEPIASLLKNPKIVFHITNDKNKIIEKWSQLNQHTDHVIIHPASLEIIPEDLTELKTALEIFQINTNNILVYKDTLEKNFDINVKEAKLDRNGLLHNALLNVPMVLVAAGPSLAKNLCFLKKHRRDIFIGAAGSALEPLIKHDIVPDFFLITDAHENIYKQFYKLDKKTQDEIPLFYLGTVSPNAIAMYGGPKIMLLQEGFGKAENLSKQFGINSVKTGGSVATALLDFLINLGAAQVCLVGQDLSFSGNKTHSDGAVGCEKLNVSNCLLSFMKIDDYSLQGKVYTSKSLYIYKKWIENYIQDHPNIQFFNATQGGAYIKGCMHVNFEQFINQLSFKENVEFYRGKFKQAVEHIINHH